MRTVCRGADEKSGSSHERAHYNRVIVSGQRV